MERIGFHLRNGSYDNTLPLHKAIVDDKMTLERLAYRYQIGSYSNTLPLHKAIADDNLEDLKSLLSKPDIDINLQDEWGGTPLYVSLIMQRSSSFVMQLIQAGCDVRIADKTKETPLHLVMASSSNEIAHELIKRGANINAQEEHLYYPSCVINRARLEENSIKKKTPLHVALQHNNLEGICMLLYYGADVSIKNSRSMTPLKYATCKNLQDMIKILINYYDESYYICNTAHDYFHFVPFTLNLTHEGTVLLTYSFRYENAEFAKLFWKKINFKSILDEEDANFLLNALIKHSQFSASDWSTYLYLIIEIFFTHRFIIRDNCFCDLINAFHVKNIQATTRLGIINVCLSLGAQVLVTDLDEAYKYYGFGEELEALIYANDYYEYAPTSSTIMFCVLALEKDFNIVILSKIFKSYFYKTKSFINSHLQLRVPVNCFINLLGFFSLPAEVKLEIKNMSCNLSQDQQKEIFKVLDQIPEFPSLLELSRNQARKYVKQTNEIKCPYHFHDAVKNLYNTPELIKDIIRFKIPLS